MNDKVLIIDDALKYTVKTYYNIKNSKKLSNLYITLIENVIDGNLNCISPNKRNNLKALGRDVIILELVKNIVKVTSYNNSRKHYPIIKTDKTLVSEDLTVELVEFLIYKELVDQGAILLINKMLENHKLLLGSIISFVDSRYDLDNKIPNLDSVQNFNDLKIISEINKMQDKMII